MSLDDLVASWEPSVPAEIRTDTIWKATVYRFALFAHSFLEADLDRLLALPRTARNAEQLQTAVDSISAAFAEGYSRGGGRDRVRFYEYALGSAREAREWLLKLSRWLDPERYSLMLELLTRCVQMLTRIIRVERNRRLG